MLLDRSGSMQDTPLNQKWTEAIGGINGYVANLRQDMTDVHIKVVAFDSVDPQEVVRDCSINDWVDLTTDEIQPRGGTPLYSAASRLINTAESENPEEAAIIIITDGGDTGGNGEYTLQGVKDAIARIQSRDWQVVYLGADFNVERQAEMMGLARGVTLSSAAGNMSYSMEMTANATRMYMTTGASMDYTDNMRATAQQNRRDNTNNT